MLHHKTLPICFTSVSLWFKYFWKWLLCFSQFFLFANLAPIRVNNWISYNLLSVCLADLLSMYNSWPVSLSKFTCYLYLFYKYLIYGFGSKVIAILWMSVSFATYVPNLCYYFLIHKLHLLILLICALDWISYLMQLKV